MKKKELLASLVLFSTITLTACSQPQSQAPPSNNAGIAYNQLQFTEVQDPPAEVKAWLDEQSREPFTGTLTAGEWTYVLVSAGEKPTAGYTVSITGIGDSEAGKYTVDAQIKKPAPESLTAQVVTYPYQLVRVPKTNLEFSFNLKTVEKTAEQAAENDPVKKDNGTYVGQIDGNSVEIKISGVPEDQAARAFRLTDKVKDNWEHFGVKTGDQVHISYFRNNEGQLVLTSIEKIQN